jgi:hypothetical protein
MAASFVTPAAADAPKYPADHHGMEGRYRIGTERIRSLAVICHALDTQFDMLFNAETICEKSPALSESYGRLFATNLLSLAVSIRVSLNQDPEYWFVTTGVRACGLFDAGAPREDGGFAVKDVCDKIIHADDICKPVESGVRGACCRLRGTHNRKPWEFGLGVSVFCEYVLEWLDRIDSAESKPNAMTQRGV